MSSSIFNKKGRPANTSNRPKKSHRNKSQTKETVAPVQKPVTDILVNRDARPNVMDVKPQKHEELPQQIYGQKEKTAVQHFPSQRHVEDDSMEYIDSNRIPKKGL